MAGISNSVDRFNGVIASLAVKVPCVAASIIPITLSGIQTVNGIAVASGDRVLVTAQANPVDNGIYDANDSTWVRSADFDGNRDVTTDTFLMAARSAGSPVFWRCTSVGSIVINSSAITWEIFFDPDAPAASNLEAVTAQGNTTTYGIVIENGATLDIESAAAADTAQLYFAGDQFLITPGVSGKQINLAIFDYTFMQEARVVGPVYMFEQATAGADVSQYGQLYVSDVPNPHEVIFRDDDGNEINLVTSLWDNGTEQVLSNSLGVAVRTALFVGNDDNGFGAGVGSVYIAERNIPAADYTGQGQFWVKDDAPNIPMFTDDAGTDFELLGASNNTPFDIIGDINTAAIPVAEAYSGELRFMDNDETTVVGGLGFDGTGVSDILRIDNRYSTGQIHMRCQESYVSTTNGSHIFAASYLSIASTGTAAAGGTSQVGHQLRFANRFDQAYFRIYGESTLDDIQIENFQAFSNIDFFGDRGVRVFLLRLVPDGSSVMYYALDSHEVMKTMPRTSGGLHVYNTATASGYERVLTTSDASGGGGTTNWSTGGGTTFATGASTIYSSGSILEFGEQASMVDPAADFGRLWVRDDAPNVLVFTDDDGDDWDLSGAGSGSGSPFATPLRILADINTATPPTTEAVTGLLEFYDNDETDLLASVGHNGIGDLALSSYMQGGDIIIQGEDPGGVMRQVANFNPDGDSIIMNKGNVRLLTAFTQQAVRCEASGTVRLYYDDVEGANTTTQALGGLNALNAYSGDGTEDRVLTDWDLGYGIVHQRFNSSTTNSDPGSGDVKFDNAAMGIATEMYIDDLNVHGEDIGHYISSMKVGDTFIVQSEVDQSYMHVFEVDVAPVDNTGWWTVGVNRIGGTGTTWPNNHVLRIIPSYAGSVGGGSGSPFTEVILLTDINTATPPSTENVTGSFEIWDADETDRLMRLGYDNTEVLDLTSYMEGAAIRIRALDNAGTERTILDADPDGVTTLRADSNLDLQCAAGETALLATANGAVTLYHNNIQMLRTATNANGAVEVDNDYSGDGWERVLTESDPVLQIAPYWEFSTGVGGGGPSGGHFAFDNAVLGSITECEFDDQSIYAGSDDFGNWLNKLASGDLLLIRDEITSTQVLLMSIDGTPVDDGGYWTIPMSYVSGTLPANSSRHCIQAQYLSQGGGGSGTITGTIANNQIAVGTTTADEIEGTAELSYFLGRLTVHGDVRNYDDAGVDYSVLSTDKIVASHGGLWLRQATPAVGNYSLLSDSSQLYLGAPTAGSIHHRINNVTKVEVDTDLAFFETDLTVDSHTLRVGSSSDHGDFRHNGADFLMEFAATADLEISGVTRVWLQNYVFEAAQTLTASEDNYVLTYNQGINVISLEAIPTTLLAAGATDVTALAAEVNLLDLAGLTAGDVLSADTATTASWKAAGGGSGTVTSSGTPLDNQIAVFTTGVDIDSNAGFTYDATKAILTGTVTRAMEVHGPSYQVTIFDDTSVNDVLDSMSMNLQDEFAWLSATDDSAATTRGIINMDLEVGTVRVGNAAGEVFINNDLHIEDNDELRFGDLAGGDVAIRWDAADLEIEGGAGNQTINFRDGFHVRLWDSSDTDWLDIHNDGANIVLTESGLGEITFPAAGTLGLNMVDNIIERAILQDFAVESDAPTVSSNAVTLDYANGPAFEVDMEPATAAIIITISGGPPTGTHGQITVKVQQDGATAQTLSFAGGTFRNAGGTLHPVTTTLDGISIYTLETWDGGTTWDVGGQDYS